METANGLNIDPKGKVRAERLSDGEEKTLRWGKIDDPNAGEYQQTLGIEGGSWEENDNDENGRFYIYKVDEEKYRVYQDDLNRSE
jgi:hypothetical protein